MSIINVNTAKLNHVQFGQSSTAENNFTLNVPATPDGTIKLSRGVPGALGADVLSIDADGKVAFTPGAGIGDVTAAGAQTLSNKTLVNPVINDGYTEEIYTASLSDSVALNPANGSIQLITHTGNITFTDSLATGQSVLLGLTPGANATTWPTITWTKVGGGGAAPTLTATGVNWIVLWKIGTTLRGSFLGTA